ncbi:hypothetical protein GCM10025787_48200 [Saccharopolyspora rosea]|uniref:Transmembrane protein n=1 Tax=Saccharopolyspora rosea TaxID=524884 RepID=A0ABW3FW29_9PSEU
MTRAPRFTGVRWLVEALRPRSNPLRRRLDRVAASLTALFLVIAVFGVPGAWWLGTDVHARAETTAAAVAARGHWVQAQVATPPELRTSGSGPEVQAVTWWARAAWTGADGRPHAGDVQVDRRIQVGGPLRVWVSAAEQVASPPDSEAKMVTAAAGVAALALGGLLITCALLIVVTRAVASALAERAWQREWEIVEPRWNRSDH